MRQVEVTLSAHVCLLVGRVRATEGAMPGLGQDTDMRLVHLLPQVLAEVVHPEVVVVLVEPAASAGDVERVLVVRVEHGVARRGALQAEGQLAPELW